MGSLLDRTKISFFTYDVDLAAEQPVNIKFHPQYKKWMGVNLWGHFFIDNIQRGVSLKPDSFPIIKIPKFQNLNPQYLLIRCWSNQEIHICNDKYSYLSKHSMNITGIFQIILHIEPLISVQKIKYNITGILNRKQIIFAIEVLQKCEYMNGESIENYYPFFSLDRSTENIQTFFDCHE